MYPPKICSIIVGKDGERWLPGIDFVMAIEHIKNSLPLDAIFVVEISKVYNRSAESPDRAEGVF